MRKENKNFGITAIFFKINISNIQYIYMCIFMLYQVICTILRNENYRKVRFKEYLSSISHPAQNKHDSATTCINLFCKICFIGVRVMVFNATFNNISVILWQSVLLVQETEVPGENYKLPQVTDKLYHIMYRVHLTSAAFELATLVAIGTDCISSCKSN